MGLGYRARFRSVKMRYLTKHKKIDKIGLVLSNTHKNGLTFGQDFDHMDPLPFVEDGAVVTDNYVWVDYEFDDIPLDGTYMANARLCLEANAPRPCTVVACVLQSEINDK